MRGISFVLGLVGAMSLAAGCPAGISGEVDGESPPAMMSAFFINTEADFGTDDTLFSLSGTGVSVFDGCNGAAKQQVNRNDLFDTFLGDTDGETDPDVINDARQELVDGQVEYDKANIPSDYWTVGASVQGIDDGEFVGGEVDIDLEDADSAPNLADGDLGGGVQICRINDFPEADKDNADVPFLKVDQDCYIATKGSVQVVAYEKDKTLQITAEVDIGKVDEDTGSACELDGTDVSCDEAGTVTVTINAGWCEPLQEAVEDFQKLLEE